MGRNTHKYVVFSTGNATSEAELFHVSLSRAYARKRRRSLPRPNNEFCDDDVVDVRAIVSFVLAIALVVVPVTKLSLGL